MITLNFHENHNDYIEIPLEEKIESPSEIRPKIVLDESSSLRQLIGRVSPSPPNLKIALVVMFITQLILGLGMMMGGGLEKNGIVLGVGVGLTLTSICPYVGLTYLSTI